MTTFGIQLFGAIEIRRDGKLLTEFRSQKALVLLAYLICENRPTTRDYLAGLGWPEMEQSQALGLLRRSLHDLNSQLPGCLVMDRRTVWFSPTVPATVDIHTFAHLLAINDLETGQPRLRFITHPFSTASTLMRHPNWKVGSYANRNSGNRWRHRYCNV